MPHQQRKHIYSSLLYLNISIYNWRKMGMTKKRKPKKQRKRTQGRGVQRRGTRSVEAPSSELIQLNTRILDKYKSIHNRIYSHNKELLISESNLLKEQRDYCKGYIRTSLMLLIIFEKMQKEGPLRNYVEEFQTKMGRTSRMRVRRSQSNFLFPLPRSSKLRPSIL